MGKFTVRVEALRGVADGYGRVRDDVSDTNQQSRPLASIQPPMADPATTAFVAAASQAGQAHLDSVGRIEQDLGTRTEELHATVRQYAGTEHDVDHLMTGRER
ncbi:PE domain-containing protein [Saccharothrix variisporea]|uniref:PE family protein n=1 Tax=Saccharothrix variisporea TaxID=543527 RepID=A0A495X0V3_9PSEU|nr:PE domain-containing protein [Saccharothrix variisporea]RKT66885.1 PE family protein [Saccharothrix variisporea]